MTFSQFGMKRVVLMILIDLVNKIGSSTYDDLVQESILDGNGIFDEDSLDYFRVDIGNGDLILEFECQTSKLFSISLSNFCMKTITVPEMFRKRLARSEVIEIFGEPIKSKPPRKIISIQTGGVDQFYYEKSENITILVYYDYESKIANTFTFIPTDGVTWGKDF